MFLCVLVRTIYIVINIRISLVNNIYCISVLVRTIYIVINIRISLVFL